MPSHKLRYLNRKREVYHAVKCAYLIYRILCLVAYLLTYILITRKSLHKAAMPVKRSSNEWCPIPSRWQT